MKELQASKWPPEPEAVAGGFEETKSAGDATQRDARETFTYILPDDPPDVLISTYLHTPFVGEVIGREGEVLGISR